VWAHLSSTVSPTVGSWLAVWGGIVSRRAGIKYRRSDRTVRMLLPSPPRFSTSTCCAWCRSPPRAGCRSTQCRSSLAQCSRSHRLPLWHRWEHVVAVVASPGANHLYASSTFFPCAGHRAGASQSTSTAKPTPSSPSIPTTSRWGLAACSLARAPPCQSSSGRGRRCSPMSLRRHHPTCATRMRRERSGEHGHGPPCSRPV
jgi:hypothetical protein